MSIYHHCMKFPTLYAIEIIRGDQAEARTCNIDLPKPRINILGDKLNTLSREAMLKRSIIIDLSKIAIREKHSKKPKDDHPSFDEKEANPHPYPEVLIVLMPMAGVNIQRSWLTQGVPSISSSPAPLNGWAYLPISYGHIQI